MPTMRLHYLLPVLALSGLPLGACGVDAHERIDSEADALRALTSAEIVGTIAFGETRAPIAYTENPRYRALRLHVDAGDEVDVWVRSTDGDAKAWLLASSFGTLASNDDGAPNVTDAHLTYRALATSDLFIAFREKNGEDAGFSVTVAPKRGAPPPLPPAGQCAVPTTAFQLDIPSATRRDEYGVALSITPSGPRLFTDLRATYFTLTQLTKSPSGWSDVGIYAEDQWNYFAARDGVNPCMAYGSLRGLRLSCATTGDRVIAGYAYGGIAIAEHAGTEHLVFVGGGSSDGLQYLTVPGGAPTRIESAGVVMATSLAVDARGTPHVAYVVQDNADEGPKRRRVKYARLGASGWNIETIADEAKQSYIQDENVVSLALTPAGAPVIAFYHPSSRSLRLAERAASGFTVTTLEAPRADAPQDDASGRGLALAVDCAGRRHIVYGRKSIFDPSSAIGLWYAQIEGGALRTPEPLPPLPETTSTYGRFQSRRQSLAFRVTPDGHQHVAAQIVHRDSYSLYYAAR